MTRTPTLPQICDAVKTTFVPAVTYIQSFDELSDGMQDTPTLQIYPQSGETDTTGNVDRSTFKAGVRQSVYVFHADLYARQRGHLAEDMGALLPIIDEMETILSQQDTAPYFGLVGIRGFQWHWERATWDYGDGVLYVGARFTMTVRVYK